MHTSRRVIGSPVKQCILEATLQAKPGKRVARGEEEEVSREGRKDRDGVNTGMVCSIVVCEEEQNKG